MKIDGYLYIPDMDDEAQQKEFLTVLKYSLSLEKVEPNYWNLSLNKVQERIYLVTLKIHEDVIGKWVVMSIKKSKFTMDDLKELNRQAEKIFREEWFYGIKDYDGIDQLLAKVDNEYFGFKPYPTTIKKAKAFWYSIATKQMFHNGNKRTALLAALLYLKLNGYIFIEKNEDKLYDVSLKLAKKEMSEEELENYILENSRIDFAEMNRISREID